MKIRNAWKKALGLFIFGLAITPVMNVNAQEYKNYNLGDIIYFNPVTAFTCQEGEDNCLKWYVVNVDDDSSRDKITLIKEDNIAISIGSEHYENVTGCYYHNKLIPYIINEFECNSHDGEWLTKNINVGGNDIDVALANLKKATENWNQSLVLAGTYGQDDFTNYKARLLTVSEIKNIMDSYSHDMNIGWSINEKGAKNEMLFPSNFRTSYAPFPEYNQLLLESRNTTDSYAYISYGTGQGIPFINVENLNYGINDIGYNNTSNTFSLVPVIEVKKSLLESFTAKIVTTINGKDKVENVMYHEGDELIFDKKGYQVENIMVTDTIGTKIEVVNNRVIAPNNDIKVTIVYQPIEYQFTEGENATYQNTDLVFKLNGEYDLVDKVLVNGIDLDSSNYTITEGSTILTLKNEYLKNLKSGTYELTVTYTNGSSDTTTFIINEKEEITSPTVEDSVDNPKTFDGILFYVGLSLVSIIGLTGAGIYFKKFAHNKTR